MIIVELLALPLVDFPDSKQRRIAADFGESRLPPAVKWAIAWADANATNLNVLCGADAKVTFPEVKKPSEKSGFFRLGVGVTDNVGKR